MDDWTLVFAYAAVVAVVTRALTQEEIFREPRECLGRICHDPHTPFLLRKLSYMPTCEFCCSFWISLAFVVGLFQFRMALADWRGYVVSVACVMGLANVYMAGFSLLRIDLRKERAVATTVETTIDKRKSA